MKFALTISTLTGLVWSFLAVVLIGGEAGDGFRISFLLAGIAAGLVAGVHTIRTRRRNDGSERFVYGVMCYYLAIVSYWAVWLVVERLSMCIRHGEWTDFDLHDHLKLVWIYLFYGTVPYGLALVPLCFLNRWIVWRAFNSKAA